MGDLINSLFPEDKSKNGVKVNGKQRKYILWLVSFALMGVLVMSIANLGGNREKTKVSPAPEQLKTEKSLPQSTSSLATIERSMEERMESILGQIAGVGEVAVNLTLSSSVEKQYAINSKIDKTEIDEQAQDGSTRKTTETREDAQVVMKSMSQGKDEPVIIKEIRPEVVGIMVVAQGASDLAIRERISEAVQTLLNIPAHRVTVLPKSK